MHFDVQSEHPQAIRLLVESVSSGFAVPRCRREHGDVDDADREATAGRSGALLCVVGQPGAAKLGGPELSHQTTEPQRDSVALDHSSRSVLSADRCCLSCYLSERTEIVWLRHPGARAHPAYRNCGGAISEVGSDLDRIAK